MNLDINTAVQLAFVITLLAGLLSIFAGVGSMRSGRKLPFYIKRRNMIMRGWRLVFLGGLFILLAFIFNQYAEPVIYRVFPPSPTITLTPTISQTPTITLSPTITPSPTETITPAISYTPAIPETVAVQFTSVVTPNTNAAFSPLVFAQKLDDNRLPVNPASEFTNPVGHLYGTFSYDNMIEGVQWSALWYRDGTLIYMETAPWNGGSGGYGYTDWNPPSDQWLPGNYEVQIFIGSQWKVSGRFIVTGEPPTPTVTLTPTFTQTSTLTPSPTNTLRPTRTETPTRTPRVTPTP